MLRDHIGQLAHLADQTFKSRETNLVTQSLMGHRREKPGQGSRYLSSQSSVCCDLLDSLLVPFHLSKPMTYGFRKFTKYPQHGPVLKYEIIQTKVTLAGKGSGW